jgi:ferredoxin
MVAIGFVLFLIMVWAATLWLKGRLYESRPFLWTLLLVHPLGFIAIELGWVTAEASLCQLGGTAPNPVLSTIRYFREEYKEHIINKRCPAKVCRQLLRYRILSDVCKRCGQCVKACPYGARVKDSDKGVAVVREALCQGCGVCVTGIKSDGTMVIDASKNRALTVSQLLFRMTASLTSSALCIGDSDANGGSHYWANTCSAPDGTLISMKDLDRTAANCDKRAKALGYASGTWSSKCTGSWVYTGPAGDGAPGFCYTRVELRGAGYTSATCPTATLGMYGIQRMGAVTFLMGPLVMSMRT